jgi:hypothetical protein
LILNETLKANMPDTGIGDRQMMGDSLIRQAVCQEAYELLRKAATPPGTEAQYRSEQIAEALRRLKVCQSASR